MSDNVRHNLSMTLTRKLIFPPIHLSVAPTRSGESWKVKKNESQRKEIPEKAKQIPRKPQKVFGSSVSHDETEQFVSLVG